MTTSVPDDDARSLLGAYALDAVDPDERAAVEQLVATDPSAAAELAQLTAVAATLGDAVAGDPPAALRASVLAAIVGTPQLGPLSGPRHVATPADEPPAAPRSGLTVVPPSATEDAPSSDAGPAFPAAPPSGAGPEALPVPDLVERRRRRAPGRWLAVAAAVVIGAAVPTTLAVQQAQRANQLEQQQQALADLLTDPSAVVVHGDMTGGGVATAILTDDAALFSAAGLPDPGDDHVYQLWVVSGDEAASAGVLADSSGSARQLADDFSSGDALAVTVEPAGGSDQPTTTPLVVLSVT